MIDGLKILQHSLGLDEFGRGKQYRNHFVTGEGTTDFPICMDLVARGLMTRRAGTAISGGDDIFYVTDAGKTYVMEKSPAPPKLTRSQQRYQDFLDADCGLSFKEFLQMRGCS